jgi:hypothetical protein
MGLPTALELKELCRTPADTATILRVATLNAIYAACTTPATDPVVTGAINYGSATTEQLECMVKDLQSAGLSVTLGASSFTVSFPR